MLNDQRSKLMEKMEDVLNRKAQYSELMKKGYEHLSQIEMGEGPPKKYVMQNLNVDVEEYRKPIDNAQIVERAKNQLENGDEMIEDMKKDLETNEFRYLGDINYYNGELKPLIDRMNPEHVFIARRIIDELVERVFKKEIEDR